MGRKSCPRAKKRGPVWHNLGLFILYWRAFSRNLVMAQTLYDKLWQSHVVHTSEDGTSILYIDRHLIHEVTSPQAFEGLKLAHRKPWRNAANLVVADHNVPTTHRSEGIADPISRLQVETLDDNAKEYGLTYFNMNDRRQGIVHVIGPEQGATLPGMTVVCGDSHTSTHGAFACLAHGIGTSEVEHVLATQTLLAKKAGISLGSLKRFENNYEISLKHLLMLALVLDETEAFHQLFTRKYYQSIDEILKLKDQKKRVRGKSNV
jgi:hypothetical protein